MMSLSANVEQDFKSDDQHIGHTAALDAKQCTCTECVFDMKILHHCREQWYKGKIKKGRSQ